MRIIAGIALVLGLMVVAPAQADDKQSQGKEEAITNACLEGELSIAGEGAKYEFDEYLVPEDTEFPRRQNLPDFTFNYPKGINACPPNVAYAQWSLWNFFNPGELTPNTGCVRDTIKNQIYYLVRPGLRYSCDFDGPFMVVDDYGTWSNIATIESVRENDLGGPSSEIDAVLTVNVRPYNGDPNNPIIPIEDIPLGDSDGADFGDVDIYTASKKKVTLTNVGNARLKINGWKIVNPEGQEAPEFAVLDSECKKTLKPGGSCEGSVQFFPRNIGTQAAIIDVESNQKGALQVPLTGNGVYDEPPTDEEGNVVVPPVPEPEIIKVPGTNTVIKDGKSNKKSIETTKKKIVLKWKKPDTDVPIVQYQTRKKFKKKSWKTWQDVDAAPNKKGWIKTKIKAKKPGRYKIQLRSITAYETVGDTVTLKVKKKKK